MASACVNNIGMSPENFLDCPASYPSYGWLSPRISFSREYTEDDSKIAAGGAAKSPVTVEKKVADAVEISDPEVFGKDVGDFEFRLDDPVTMLPADELFSEGKLVPLQLSAARPVTETMPVAVAKEEIRSEDVGKFSRRNEFLSVSSSSEAYLFSPKAPRCSSRWRELLGLKKLYQNCSNGNKASTTSNATTSSNSSSSSSSAAKSIKHFLHRSSKSTVVSSSACDGASLSVPLLKEYSDCESVSISSRLSLSSSSSGHDHDDLPRLSLDADKPNNNHSHISLSRSSSGQNSNPNQNPPKLRVVKARPLIDHPMATGSGCSTNRMGRSMIRRAQQDPTIITRGVSVDSPRMNSSGKIVFQSLERSSSSPSSFNGGPRYKYRGMERSYSANVRITPVLNVPVCSLRGSSKFGFGQLFSTPSLQKKEGNNGVGGSTKTAHHHHHHHHQTNSSRSSRRESS
ncbi:hypothetical protein Ancab_025727 [Ancistrocladus abbreviatus]